MFQLLCSVHVSKRPHLGPCDSQPGSLINVEYFLTPNQQHLCDRERERERESDSTVSAAVSTLLSLGRPSCIPHNPKQSRLRLLAGNRSLTNIQDNRRRKRTIISHRPHSQFPSYTNCWPSCWPLQGNWEVPVPACPTVRAQSSCQDCGVRRIIAGANRWEIVISPHQLFLQHRDPSESSRNSDYQYNSGYNTTPLLPPSAW